jgi:hypothetical protein
MYWDDMLLGFCYQIINYLYSYTEFDSDECEKVRYESRNK